jgi:hypothetical protein
MGLLAGAGGKRMDVRVWAMFVAVGLLGVSGCRGTQLGDGGQQHTQLEHPVPQATSQGRRAAPARGEIVLARASIEAGAGQKVRGRVRYVGPRTVRIEDDAARWYDLKLTVSTVVTWEGNGSSALRFVDGTLVDAEYRLDNGEKVATRVRVLELPN